MDLNLGCPEESRCEGSASVPLLLSESGDLSPASPDQSQCEVSQLNSSSNDFSMTLPKFLEAFPNPPLLIRSGAQGKWVSVFCSQSENKSCSADLGTSVNIIHDKMIHAFCNMNLGWSGSFAQFWAPVTIDGRLLLSTSGQPFAVTDLSKIHVVYRLDSEKNKYDIDVKNKLHLEGDPMISSGGPTTAFRNRLSCRTLLEEDDNGRKKYSFMLPICFPSDSSCVGVLELTMSRNGDDFGRYVLEAVRSMKESGLHVCNGHEHIPYKTINNLRAAKDEIKHALEIVCGLLKLSLAQVWIAVEDRSHVPLSSISECTGRIFGLKLTGYLLDECLEGSVEVFRNYSGLCSVIPQGIRGQLCKIKGTVKEFALETLKDLKSRYISTLLDDGLVDWEEPDSSSSALTICLRSIGTGDFNFVFEFIWLKRANSAILLEVLLLILKKCLPSFRFASGAELDDESDVIEVNCSKYDQASAFDIDLEYDQIGNFKIFQAKTSPPCRKALEEGRQPMVVDYIAPSEVTPEVLPLESAEKQFDFIGVESPTRGKTSNIKVFQGKRLSPICKSVEEDKEAMVKGKTTEILLSREIIENQFGKTMKEAARNLHVSLSTLKRKFKDLGIPEWPGPNSVKRRAKDASATQIKTTDEDNGGIQDPLTKQNKNTVTLKAEYADDMIKIHLPVSQATFQTIEKEIGMKLKLSVGSYKLKYLDEDGDWMPLASEEEMSDCIKSSRKLDQILVRLRVVESTKPTTSPNSS